MPPYQTQDVKEINELVSVLNKHNGKKIKGGFTCRKSTFNVEGTDMKVDGWKFNDWDYKKRDLPIEARGLFTYRDPRTGNYEIVTRGYDKFFNIGEVHRTNWSWIEEHTQGPYELTVKENGCIIFISGLPGDHLLVCSKHSTGGRADVDVSHAQAGERWVDRQLEKIGKTRADLAKTLRAMNATAVAELCDDSFEEHILAYEGDDAGLYLHGINLNVPQFTTYSADDVHKFADEWAFKKIDVLIKKSVSSLREFLEQAAETGSWDGKDVEGFVIRCKARYGPNDPNWHDWFFKYKFEEPYLMYRQWREVTKATLSGKVPVIRKHKEITREYLSFAARYFAKNPKAVAAYKANHGIIALRDAFLKERGMKGSDIIRQEIALGLEKAEPTKLVLVPIATIGCGKTTVAHALAQLFGWGHIQNDNIVGKNQRGARFAQAIASSLATDPVCIADRNNHQRRERDQIIQDVKRIVPDATFVALHFVHGKEHTDPELREKIRQVTRNRVFKRGDNHQTIQAASQGEHQVISIMEGFLHRFEPFDPDNSADEAFDMCIDLDVLQDSRTNVETVAKALKDKYPNIVGELPSASELDEAIESALKEYSPDIKHTIGGSNRQAKQLEKREAKKKQAQAEYFAVKVPAQTILSKLKEAFADKEPGIRKFYVQLTNMGRVQPAFHVTLIHRASSSEHKELWDDYVAKATAAPSFDAVLDKVTIILDKIVWDNRVMAISASLPEDSPWKCVNAIPHITIGTADKAIKPVESNRTLEQWREGSANGKIQTLEIPGDKTVEGEVQVVLRR